MPCKKCKSTFDNLDKAPVLMMYCECDNICKYCLINNGYRCPYCNADYNSMRTCFKMDKNAYKLEKKEENINPKDNIPVAVWEQSNNSLIRKTFSKYTSIGSVLSELGKSTTGKKILVGPKEITNTSEILENLKQKRVKELKIMICSNLPGGH